MSQYLCPKVALNTAVLVLVFISSLAKCLKYLNTFLTFMTYVTLVAATIAGWLMQPTELLYDMVKHPLGCVINYFDFVKKLNNI